MIFRGKIMGIGESPGIGRILLIRPYAIEDDMGYCDIPTTPEAIEAKVREAGLLGEKVEIEIRRYE